MQIFGHRNAIPSSPSGLPMLMRLRATRLGLRQRPIQILNKLVHLAGLGAQRSDVVEQPAHRVVAYARLMLSLCKVGVTPRRIAAAPLHFPVPRPALEPSVGGFRTVRPEVDGVLSHRVFLPFTPSLHSQSVPMRAHVATSSFSDGAS